MAQIMHLTQQDKGLQADLLAREISTNIPGHWYMAEDTERYFYAGSDGTLIPFAFATEIQDDYIQSVANTPGIGLAVDANGQLTATPVVSADTDNVLELVADGFKVKDIAIEAGSAPFLAYNAATREISVTQLLVSDVTVNNTEADLAAFIAANYTAGTEYQSGDVVILQQENKAYIHNGGTAGTDADFSPIEVPGTSDAQIRALFSGDDVVSYNPATGAFTFVLDPNSDSSASVSATGLKIDVSAGEVTDTNDVLGGGVAEVSLQTLLDGISGTTKTAIQSYTVSGDTGTTSFDKGDNVTYSGGSLLATSVTETNGEVAVNTDFDTTGATAGQIIKLVDDGTGTLIPEWTVDSASGFQQYSVPFAAADGTLIEENDLFRYNDTENKFHINLPDAERALGDWRAQSNFTIRYDGADNGGTQPENITTFGISGGGGAITFAYQDVGNAVPKLDLVSRNKKANGEWQEYGVGDKVGAIRMVATVNQSYKANSGGKLNNPFDIISGVITESTGDYANSNHEVSVGFALNAKVKGTAYASSTPVISGSHTQEITFHGYENGGTNNFLSTDATGKVVMTENYLPGTLGTADQILKVVDDGNGNVSLQWAEDLSGAFTGADNGLSFDAGTGNVQLGGALIQNTAIDLTGTAGSGQDFSYSITGEETDIYFGMISGGITMRSADMGFYLSDSQEGTVFKDTRTGAAQVGMQYAGDYSANFVNESLITKRYVDSVVEGLDFTQYTINNGLTELTDGNGNSTVQLGGTLVQATTINLQDKDFSITGTSGKFTANTDMYFGTAAQGVILKSPNGTQWRLGVTDFGAATFSSI